MPAVIAVGSDPSNLVDITPDPSALTWGLQDISSSDAGRTQEYGNPMYKMRLSQKRKLNLTWTLPTIQQVSRILQAFNGEYFYVRYLDAMSGQYEVREFYAGDRSAPYKWHELPGSMGTRFATLSFDIIER